MLEHGKKEQDNSEKNEEQESKKQEYRYPKDVLFWQLGASRAAGYIKEVKEVARRVDVIDQKFDRKKEITMS